MEQSVVARNGYALEMGPDLGKPCRMSTIVLQAGEDRVEVDPSAGSRIASLVAAGSERLVTEGASGGSPTGWGCFLMAPWAGRVRDAVVPFRGRLVPVRRNLPPHAIHGVAFDKRWEVLSAGDTTCETTLALPEDEWPFGGRVRQQVTLTPGRLGLSAEIQATDQAMPLSLGWHPWFTRPSEGDLRVRVDAGSTLVTGEDLIPTGETEAVHGPTDLREGPVLGDRRLDTVYAGPRGPAVVAWPDLEMAIDLIPPVATVVVYTPEGAACVEPQTAWPDAPALAAGGIEGTGLLELEPGASIRASTALRWARPS